MLPPCGGDVDDPRPPSPDAVEVPGETPSGLLTWAPRPLPGPLLYTKRPYKETEAGEAATVGAVCSCVHARLTCVCVWEQCVRACACARARLIARVCGLSLAVCVHLLSQQMLPRDPLGALL